MTCAHIKTCPTRMRYGDTSNGCEECPLTEKLTDIYRLPTIERVTDKRDPFVRVWMGLK